MRYPSTTPGAGTSSTSDYEELVYDAGGNVTSRRLRGYAGDSSKHIDFAYDALGRVTAKDLPGSELDVAYTWDLLGELTDASRSDHDLAFQYDALGRLTRETGPLGATATLYDLAGRRIAVNWDDGFYVEYDRLVTGELLKVRQEGATSGAGVLASYAYDQLGRRTGVTRGNGTVTSYGYDAVSRLASLSHDFAGTGSDVTTTFAYTSASQIASTTRDNDGYAWTGAANAARSYTVNGLNQATADTGTSIGYDARGNATSIGSASYGYASENLLTGAPGSVTLTYDPLMRLYRSSSPDTRLRYTGSELTGEYDNAGVAQKRYVHGDGADEPLVELDRNGSGTYDRKWLHADERGSVIALSNDSGAVSAVNSYDEYGVPASGNTGRFQYTGQTWMPELGMYYYKARVYDPFRGRFMQTDPIGYGGGFHWYNYVSSDPINLIDPDGLRWVYNCLGLEGYEVCGYSSDGAGDSVCDLFAAMCHAVDSMMGVNGPRQSVYDPANNPPEEKGEKQDRCTGARARYPIPKGYSRFPGDPTNRYVRDSAGKLAINPNYQNI